MPNISASLKGYLIGEGIVVLLTIIIVATRLAVRAWRQTWSYWLSDAFLVLAVVAFAAIAIADIITDCQGDILPGNQYNESYAKWSFASTILFDTSFYYPRFSLLAFYFELFPPSEARLRTWLYVAIGYTVSCYLVTFGIDMFWCGLDVYRNWLPESEQSCVIANSVQRLYVYWSIGFSSELFVFFLPLPLLGRLKKLQAREMTGLVLIFMLGLTTITVSSVRFANSVESIFSRSNFIVAYCEIATQIIVVALPALRPLLRVSRVRSGAPDDQDKGGSDDSRGTNADESPDDLAHVESSAGTGRAANSMDAPPWEKMELPRI